MTDSIKRVEVPKNTIFVSSPFGGCDLNRIYAENICKRMIRLGYNPFAPHAYYSRFLDDADPLQRSLAITYGLIMMSYCSEVWMFIHDGITPGMKKEEIHANKLGLPIKRVDWSNVIRKKTK